MVLLADDPAKSGLSGLRQTSATRAAKDASLLAPVSNVIGLGAFIANLCRRSRSNRSWRHEEIASQISDDKSAAAGAGR